MKENTNAFKKLIPYHNRLLPLPENDAYIAFKVLPSGLCSSLSKYLKHISILASILEILAQCYFLPSLPQSLSQKPLLLHYKPRKRDHISPIFRVNHMQVVNKTLHNEYINYNSY